MNQAELLRYVVKTLESFEINYMLKLLYFQQGGSERHLRDIAGMLRVSAPEIDTRYIEDWAQRLGVDDIWQPVRQRAEAT